MCATWQAALDYCAASWDARVRQLQGCAAAAVDAPAFSLPWLALSLAERTAAETLGFECWSRVEYKSTSGDYVRYADTWTDPWTDGSPPYSRAWADLESSEREAAQTLGHDEQSWDADEWYSPAVERPWSEVKTIRHTLIFSVASYVTRGKTSSSHSFAQASCVASSFRSPL